MPVIPDLLAEPSPARAITVFVVIPSMAPDVATKDPCRGAAPVVAGEPAAFPATARLVLRG